MVSACGLFYLTDKSISSIGLHHFNKRFDPAQTKPSNVIGFAGKNATKVCLASFFLKLSELCVSNGHDPVADERQDIGTFFQRLTFCGR